MSGSVLVIAPMLPAMQERMGFTTTGLGLISGVSLVTAMIAELVLGPQADRGHERLLCIGGMLLAPATLVWSALAGSLAELVVSRALAGVAYAAFVSSAYAIVIRRDPDGVGEGIARIQAAEFAGLAAGPLVGALLEPWLGMRGALLVVAAITVAAVPLCLGLRAAPAAVTERPPVLAFDLITGGAVQVALLLAIAVMVPVGAFDAMWARYLTDLGASHVMIAVSFAATTLPFLVIAGYAGRMVDRAGPMRGATWGAAVIVVALSCYALVGNVWAIVGVGVGEAFGQALAGPAAAAAMARATGPRRAGAGQGLARAVSMLAAGAVAILAGPAYAAWGGAAVFGGAAVGVAVVVVAARVLAGARAPELLEVESTRGEVTAPAVPALEAH